MDVRGTMKDSCVKAVEISPVAFVSTCVHNSHADVRRETRACRAPGVGRNAGGMQSVPRRAAPGGASKSTLRRVSMTVDVSASTSRNIDSARSNHFVSKMPKENAVVEVWRSKRLVWGIVTELQEKHVVVDLVQPQDMQVLRNVRVSLDEVVGTWGSSSVISSSADADEEPVHILAAKISRATAVLQKAAPRSLNLEKLHAKMARLEKGNPKSHISSATVADFFYAQRVLRVPSDPDVERICAGLVLASDSVKFKRGAPGTGWRALPGSVAASRAANAFELECAAILNASEHSPASSSAEQAKQVVWSAEHLQLLRALEVFAISGPPASTFPKSARAPLSALGFGHSQSETKRFLQRIGFWSKSDLDENGNRTSWAFPEHILEAAREQRDAAFQRRSQLQQSQRSRSAKQSTFSSTAYCIDDKSATFRDDAVSCRLVTVADQRLIRVCVHVADVDAVVPRDSAVDLVARDRAQSIYLPRGPLHMLPAFVVEAASFSTDLPTEAITIDFMVNPERNEVVSWDISRNVVPAVHVLTFEQAIDLLKAAPEGPLSQWLALLKEATNTLLRVLPADQPRRQFRADFMSVRSAQRGKAVVVDKYEFSEVHEVLDSVLNVAGHYIREFARKHRAYLPERRGSRYFAMRCGTAPMRKYMDLAIQRQIKAVLTGHEPSRREQMVQLNKWIESRLVENKQVVQEQRQVYLYEALADHCAKRKASSVGGSAIMDATVISRNANKVRVRLLQTGLSAVALVNANGVLSSQDKKTKSRKLLQPNDPCQVLVEHVDVQTRQIRIRILAESE
ncbi:putative ribonuclease [Porphyridium purpureum]|uniref:Putative ribonuclease n=1 Tax=Porphyridium purpureum TaxID=35688 RepID=A0A5J4YVF8_PORPP|nr:putative ribonuclease [Porphyridium purpureum]|eukprot:POR1069..scf227_4